MRKQWEQVYDAMMKYDGFATLSQLYDLINFKTWGAKDPHATVRRIVQTHEEFFKIKPGLWGLTQYENDIRKKVGINKDNTFKNRETKHSYYQGAIASIGNIRQYKTFIPYQDKNKLYLNVPLKNITNVENIFEFAYKDVLEKAKTVDVIWFNIRKMPNSFFEIENSTNITDSLVKFYELQDYYANFNIVIPLERINEFKMKIEKSIYNDIKERVHLITYDDIDKQLEYENKKVSFF